jgi:predicted metal-dependent hydrolase
MDAHLRAGIAVYNAGRYHAAHDAWEEYWLDLDSGDDEQFLHGLIQFTAVVHHGTDGNWSGAEGLAESAGEYLDGLPADYRGVNLDAVRPFLARVADDPERVDWTDPPKLTRQDLVVGYDDLGFDATAVAAEVLAEADGYDDAVVADAVEYARSELNDQGEGRFVGQLFAFVRETANRSFVFAHLSNHVDRERQKDDDVAGLFDC